MAHPLKIALSREEAKLERQEQAMEATKTLIALLKQQVDALDKGKR